MSERVTVLTKKSTTILDDMIKAPNESKTELLKVIRNSLIGNDLQKSIYSNLGLLSM